MRQRITEEARNRIKELCSKISVCRPKPDVIQLFGLNGYETFLLHLDEPNYGDGFVITCNGIYSKRWNAGKQEIPYFISFEDIGRAADIRYDGDYRYFLMFPGKKEAVIAYYSLKRSDSVATIKLENLFRNIINICREDLFFKD